MLVLPKTGPGCVCSPWNLYCVGVEEGVYVCGGGGGGGLGGGIPREAAAFGRGRGCEVPGDHLWGQQLNSLCQEAPSILITVGSEGKPFSLTAVESWKHKLVNL